MEGEKECHRSLCIFKYYKYFQGKRKGKKKTRPEGYRYMVSSGQVLDNLESVQLIKIKAINGYSLREQSAVHRVDGLMLGVVFYSHRKRKRKN